MATRTNCSHDLQRRHVFELSEYLQQMYIIIGIGSPALVTKIMEAKMRNEQIAPSLPSCVP